MATERRREPRDADARTPGEDARPRGAAMSRRDALRITAVAGIGIAVSAATVRELLERAALHRVSVTRTQLGTPFTVTVMHPDAAAGRALVDATFAEVERLEGILSRYRATSALAALNRDGIVRGAPVELTQVMARALEYSEMTGGAFDPTVAPVLNLYVSRFAGGTLPSEAEIEAARALVGWHDLHVEGSTIALARPGMAVTLDAIAKGFVVDRGVAALGERGAERVIVQASGDMHAAGADEDPWPVAIQDPKDMQGTLGVVALRGSIASSGDYMQAFTPDRSLNHIIDPRTGRSPLESSGTTVLASSAMDADAASTSAFVLGPQAGVAFLDRFEGVEGVVVDKAGRRFPSKGFEKQLL